jgi:hypothetical protein
VQQLRSIQESLDEVEAVEQQFRTQAAAQAARRRRLDEEDDREIEVTLLLQHLSSFCTTNYRDTEVYTSTRYRTQCGGGTRMMTGN